MNNRFTLQIQKKVVKIVLIVKIILVILGLQGTAYLIGQNSNVRVYAFPTVEAIDDGSNCSANMCGACNKDRCSDYPDSCRWVAESCMPTIKTTTENTTGDGNSDSLIPEYPDEVFVGKTRNGILGNSPTVGGIVSGLLPYVYVIAGLILLIMLVMGGLGLMTAAGNPDKMKAGYGKITNALIGFLIIFVSYFVVQLVEIVLKIKIF